MHGQFEPVPNRSTLDGAQRVAGIRGKSTANVRALLAGTIGLAGCAYPLEAIHLHGNTVRAQAIGRAPKHKHPSDTSYLHSWGLPEPVYEIDPARRPILRTLRFESLPIRS